jgi:hypothetical protein
MRTIHLCGETLPHPGHVCAFFDSREQKYDVLVPFLKDAIAAGDEVVNIVDGAEMPAHLDELEAGGVPLHKAMSTGQLNVLTSEETYLQEGEDVLPRLLDFLGETLRRVRDEERCLRTMGEMNWIGRGAVPVKDVLAYEARVNELFSDHECTLLCIYDLARTPPELMMDILATHPSAIIQGRLRPNPHYVETQEYLQMLNARH